MQAADGSVLAEIPFRHADEIGHRFPVRYDQIPLDMIHAILAAEDVRFFSHRGVDLRAVARAAWANYRAKRIVEGASTITQQVARNLLPSGIGNQRTLRRKVREALLARRIERRYSKQRIFEVYVNQAFMGASAYGIAAAARAYFDKELDELALHETAMIAGLMQALDAAAASTNLFYALRADGRFDWIKLRAVPRQEKPYPPLVDVTADQPEFEHRGIAGSLVGFRFPDYTQGLNVPGYHLHFLSDDRTAGGHVLAFSTRQARVEIDVTSQFHMALLHDGAFLDADLDKDGADDIRKAEK